MTVHHVSWDGPEGWTTVEIEARDMPGDEEVIREVLDGNGYFVRHDDFNIRAGVVVDIGAHIGCVSVAALLHRPSKIIAIEPEPDNYDLLQGNLARNSARLGAGTTIVPMAAAVGNPKVAEFVTVQGDSSRSVVRYTNDDEMGGSTPVLGWPDICELVDGQEIAFLKIDCEGGEYSLFDTIERLDNVRRIHMEWHTYKTGHAGNVGNIVEKLLYTHTVEVFGRPDQGGMLAARRNW